MNLFGSYRAAIRLHDTAGIVVSFSFLLWLGYYLLVVHKMRQLYMPTLDDLSHGMPRQAKYYFLTYFLGAENPHHPDPAHKFNALQKSAYLVIMMVLVPLVIGSGLLAAQSGVAAGSGAFYRRHQGDSHCPFPARLRDVRFSLHPCLPGHSRPYAPGALQADVDRLGGGRGEAPRVARPAARERNEPC